MTNCKVWRSEQLLVKAGYVTALPLFRTSFIVHLQEPSQTVEWNGGQGRIDSRSESGQTNKVSLPEGRESTNDDSSQWSAGYASSHCVRLSALRASVEPPTRGFSVKGFRDPA